MECCSGVSPSSAGDQPVSSSTSRLVAVRSFRRLSSSRQVFIVIRTPRWQRRIVLEIGYGAVDAQHGFLKAVLRVLAVAAHPKRNRVHAAFMRAHQQFKRAASSPCDALRTRSRSSGAFCKPITSLPPAIIHGSVKNTNAADIFQPVFFGRARGHQVARFCHVRKFIRVPRARPPPAPRAENLRATERKPAADGKSPLPLAFCPAFHYNKTRISPE